jgi:hypothetical protein
MLRLRRFSEVFSAITCLRCLKYSIGLFIQDSVCDQFCSLGSEFLFFFQRNPLQFSLPSLNSRRTA